MHVELHRKPSAWRSNVSVQSSDGYNLSSLYCMFVFIRYLATGDSLKTLALSYSLGYTTVWRIVRETCPVIWHVLNAKYLPQPTKQHWVSTCEVFEQRWNFPHCIGAIDGKHIVIQAPDNSGSIYFNYKKTFSLVLLALVDGDYRFGVVDIGAYGKHGIWNMQVNNGPTKVNVQLFSKSNRYCVRDYNFCLPAS